MSTQGSISKDASGSWSFVVDGRSRAGKRQQVRRRGFKTKREAQAALAELLSDTKAGRFVKHNQRTVGGYLVDTWLPSMASAVRPSTHDTYRRLVGKHIVPALGDERLQDVDPAMVTQFLGALSAAGLSAKSVRNIHAVVSKAFADAVDLGVVVRNPATNAKLPRVERQSPRAWSAEQLAEFLRAVEGDRLEPLWRFLVATGCRRGEALGLQWSGVDLDAGIVRISRQRVVVGGRVSEGPPKTVAGVRTLALDPETISVLRSWKAVQAKERLVMGAGWASTGGLVFTNADGGGLWPQTVTARFKTIADDLGLQAIGVHGLRHSAASWMIASGVSPKLVSERLGHSNVAITLSLYTHVLPAHDQAAADAFGMALMKARTRKARAL